jgi:Domain of unknown function (DUF4423)
VRPAEEKQRSLSPPGNCTVGSGVSKPVRSIGTTRNMPESTGLSTPTGEERYMLTIAAEMPGAVMPSWSVSAVASSATEPDSEAILRIMETAAYRSLRTHRAGALAEVLGVAPELEARVLAALEDAGILQAHGGHYRPLQPLNVDTSAEPAALNRLKAHWTRLALERLAAPRSQDWLGYNLISLSAADLERVREILRDAYREIRALAAASEPVESAALLNVQLVTFTPVSG